MDAEPTVSTVNELVPPLVDADEESNAEYSSHMALECLMRSMSSNITPDGRRFCSQCGVLKERDEFYRNKRSPDGRQSICKECSRADAAIRRAVARIIKKYPPPPRHCLDLKPTVRVGLLDLPSPDLPPIFPNYPPTHTENKAKGGE